MGRVAHVITAALGCYGIMVGCTHVDRHTFPSESGPEIVEDDRSEMNHETLILRKNDPQAPAILKAACPGGYSPTDDFSTPPSTEVGISQKIGGTTETYVRYSCRGQ